MKQRYITPIIEFDLIESDQSLLASSQPDQCSCYESIFNNGCQGCQGHCGCNHWDSDLGELIPGC